MNDPALLDLLRRVRMIVFDFDGVFTDNTVYVNQDGVEAVRCWRSDGLGLRLLREVGVAAVVLSTEENPVVTARCRKLKIRCVQGCADKPARLRELAAEQNLSFDQIAYLGNDTNDEGCLRLAGLPMVVEDAHTAVAGLARYRTHARGGFGAVREVCDLLHAALGASLGRA